jgi:threonine/homoserine/homoserine lactone efflux protein
MWEIPTILLWPFLGWRFPMGTTTLDEYILFYLTGALASPEELAGALVLVWFAIQLFRQRTLLRFLRTGSTE